MQSQTYYRYFTTKVALELCAKAILNDPVWVVFGPFWHLLSVVRLLLWVAAGIYIGSEHDTWFPITFNGPHHQPPRAVLAKTLQQALRPGLPI